MRWLGVRGVTALLLALAATLFTIGAVVERAGHTETPAEHAAEVNGPPSTASARPSAAPSPSATHSAGPARSPSKDLGLTAPEGSKEREAAEKRRRASASASPQAAAGPRTTVTAAPTSASPSTGTPEGSAAREAAERAGSTQPTSHAEASERLFGINTEATPLIVAADLLALLLVALVLVLSGLALVLTGLTVAASGLTAVGLDLREALHQHDLGRTGLLVLVLLVACLHLASAASGALLARRSQERAAATRTGQPTTPSA